MIREMVGVVVCLALVGAVFVVASVARRAKLGAELTRKLAHFATTLVVLLLPALIHRVASAVALALGAAILVATLRRARRLSFLDDVERSHASEYAFIAAVGVVFVLARGDALLFRAPILVLGVSDALAAIVGTRWGRHRYVVRGATRSWEGSLAFVASAFAILAATLVATGRATPFAFVAIAIVATVVAAVEAITTAGLDNLTIPLATYGLLAGSGL
jgi:dolichol kinase